MREERGGGANVRLSSIPPPAKGHLLWEGKGLSRRRKKRGRGESRGNVSPGED